jgi:hypothetical protein
MPGAEFLELTHGVLGVLSQSAASTALYLDTSREQGKAESLALGAAILKVIVDAGYDPSSMIPLVTVASVLQTQLEGLCKPEHPPAIGGTA